MSDTLIHERDLYDAERDGTPVRCDECGHPGMDYDMRGSHEAGFVCWPCIRDNDNELYMTHERYR